jgi:hypothetical protein
MKNAFNLFFIFSLLFFVSCTDSCEKEEVPPNNPPQIACTVTTATVPVGILITLWYEVSDKDGDYVSVKFVTGDGRVIRGTSANVRFSYPWTGIYEARLIASDGTSETVWNMTFYVVY